jgi:hypothetical protein
MNPDMSKAGVFAGRVVSDSAATFSNELGDGEIYLTDSTWLDTFSER